ncbi:putative membrane protein YfkQ [Paenibacillus glycanilyticus]|uniref:Membrane protein YfkQ n=1 Tax=Paenibacillus glycanilyticus TaxID=126569 RepID=A0ABQ6NHN1_9BACL|nr:spore germination protein [Paenibacillus glycanilyticus]GMK44606.1 putative membrane protein YfkQ [Paenibacillus glycanilyticus]
MSSHNERTVSQRNAAKAVSPSLSENEQTLRSIFENCSDVVFRRMTIQGNIFLLLVYVDGMIDKDLVQNTILKPLLYEGIPQGLGTLGSLAQMLDMELIAALQTQRITKFEEAADLILKGNVAFLADGDPFVLLADVSQYETRSIEEPSTEAALRGTRESFTELLRTNTTLLRRIIVTPDLKMESFQIGKLTKTEVVLAYIDGLSTPALVNEVRTRIGAIDIQSVLESGYIEEYIEDTSYSPFPQMQSTERADVVSAGLLEGRVAVFVNGSPIVLVVPMTFWDGLQAPDDYYERFLYVTMNRWIRYLFALFSILFPSIYIALTTYHPEMMPPKLMLSITGLREQSPFPTVIEVFLMEFMFEGLREAGIRLPQQIGPLVSIVGALVIGQAAVQAGIISAPIVIVVSAAGISSFVIPRYRFGYPLRMLRFPLLVLSGLFGLFGVALGLIMILSHLIHLSPLGTPYLEPIAPTSKSKLQNVFLRRPRKRTS